MNIKCAITDDEPVALEILTEYIQITPGLELKLTCRDALETFQKLHSQHIDVLFIDINMPEMTGIELVRSLKNPPIVVFTTAFPHHALEGFELNAVDYLLKPISFERFLRCTDKLIRHYFVNKSEQQIQADTHSAEYRFFKTGKGFERIRLDDIRWVEGYENYVKIKLENRIITALNTMKNMEMVLPENKFMRIHRSYIVNVSRIEYFADNSVRIQDNHLMVGKSYRKFFTEWIRKSSFPF